MPITTDVALVAGLQNTPKECMDLFLLRVTALSFLMLSLTFIEEPAFCKIATFLKSVVLRFGVHQNHLEGWLQHRLWGSTCRAAESVDLTPLSDPTLGTSNQLPGGANAAGAGNTH